MIPLCGLVWEPFAIENGETKNAVMLSCGMLTVLKLVIIGLMADNGEGHIYCEEHILHYFTPEENETVKECPHRCPESVAFDPILPVKIISLPSGSSDPVSEACKLRLFYCWTAKRILTLYEDVHRTY